MDGHSIVRSRIYVILVVVIVVSGCVSSARRAPVPSAVSSSPQDTASRPTTHPSSSRGLASSSTGPHSTASTGQTGEVAIVIVELNSEDPAASQDVVVRNGRSTAVDLTCWSLHSTVKDTTTTIAKGTVDPHHGLRLLAPYGAFAGADTITLVDAGGRVVDRTPRLRDASADSRLWFRLDGRWRFGHPTTPLAVADGQVGSAEC